MRTNFFRKWGSLLFRSDAIFLLKVFALAISRADLNFKDGDGAELQKRVGETNNYLKDLCGFYGLSFIDNSSITEKYLHHDEIHLNKSGSFLLNQNFVSDFNESS